MTQTDASHAELLENEAGSISPRPGAGRRSRGGSRQGEGTIISAATPSGDKGSGRLDDGVAGQQKRPVAWSDRPDRSDSKLTSRRSTPTRRG